MKWWEEYGNITDIEKSVANLPEKLCQWFFEMFEYAGHSDTAKGIMQNLFSEDGPLHDSEKLKTGLGSELFRFLAMADPVSATDHLEKTMGKWTQGELKNFVVGRRSIIYGLERIIFEPELFTKGGILLRSLAENENEYWSNNATGIFCGMFSLGPGYVSMTKTPPTMRIPLLKETLCAQSEIRRSLGLKACSSALESMHFSRASGLSSDELRVDQKGWEPKTRKEWQEAYQEVIELLYEKIKAFPENDQKRCAEIIVNGSRGLLNAFPDISDYVVDKLSRLRDFIDHETILKEIISIIEFDKDKLKPEIITKLENLQSEITGNDYPSLMNRYVKMDIMTDLARKNHENVREEKIKGLCKESLDVSKLQSQLDWLVTYDAKYGYKFGYELSSLDENKILLPVILDVQRKSDEKGSGFFLSGYLLKILETDKEKWNTIMREISNDEKLLRFFGELSWRSGITDEVGLLLLELIKKNKLEINELSNFVLGGVVNKLSIEVVLQWVKLMIQCKEQKIIFSALVLFNSFFVYGQKKSLDVELTLQLLTHNAFFGKEHPPSFDIMVDHYWKEVALELIEQYPEKSRELCKKILENMGEIGTIVRTHSRAMEVLDKVASKFPNETWNLVTQYIDLPFDERGFAIINWMRGGMFEPSDSFLELVDYKKIFDWIDHDPHRRASYIANYAPPYLRKDNCLVRELLKKYGNDEAVQRSLLANFSTGSFSGHASQHYQTIKEKMITYKESEDDENVKKWIDFYVKVLDEDIKREKIREEREF